MRFRRYFYPQLTIIQYVAVFWKGNHKISCMTCPKCHRETTSVIDSRDIEARAIRRRRQCDRCGFRFTTYERFEMTGFSVLKRNGTVEPYHRQKLIRGAKLACHRCPVDQEQFDQMADRIEAKLIEEGTFPMPTKRIGQLVIKELRKLDEVAYLRFISVFKEFKTLKSFSSELEKLRITSNS